MFLLCFPVFRVRVRLVSRMGCPRPWEERGFKVRVRYVSLNPFPLLLLGF